MIPAWTLAPLPKTSISEMLRRPLMLFPTIITTPTTGVFVSPSFPIICTKPVASTTEAVIPMSITVAIGLAPESAHHPSAAHLVFVKQRACTSRHPDRRLTSSHNRRCSQFHADNSYH
ncbi:hypothetical protein BDV24DRAFT_135395 [Aspergillus arachidicola]|uniref:Uncharacterized protein n=1 Tax=Aspergillus arachidicola TaxID=656916 RepID=A0A5N6Y5V4_9EURO|nr:hypothetical protein BDV24DRAFT_135395 [Aspergillus arachidicola]